MDQAGLDHEKKKVKELDALLARYRFLEARMTVLEDEPYHV